MPPKKKRGRAKRHCGGSGNGEDRLMIRGKVEGDAGAEGNGYPRQEPAGAGFGANPFTQGFDERRPGTKA